MARLQQSEAIGFLWVPPPGLWLPLLCFADMCGVVFGTKPGTVAVPRASGIHKHNNSELKDGYSDKVCRPAWSQSLKVQPKGQGKEGQGSVSRAGEQVQAAGSGFQE